MFHFGKRKEEVACVPICGGAYNLYFETGSEEKIDSIHVGIACSPDSYPKMPIPKKEGYHFLGWYYDKEYQSKVEATTTREVKPSPLKKKDCIIGYQDITIFAKWERKK